MGLSYGLFGAVAQDEASYELCAAAVGQYCTPDSWPHGCTVPLNYQLHLACSESVRCWGSFRRRSTIVQRIDPSSFVRSALCKTPKCRRFFPHCDTPRGIPGHLKPDRYYFRFSHLLSVRNYRPQIKRTSVPFRHLILTLFARYMSNPLKPLPVILFSTVTTFSMLLFITAHFRGISGLPVF